MKHTFKTKLELGGSCYIQNLDDASMAKDASAAQDASSRLLLLRSLSHNRMLPLIRTPPQLRMLASAQDDSSNQSASSVKTPLQLRFVLKA